MKIGLNSPIGTAHTFAIKKNRGLFIKKQKRLIHPKFITRFHKKVEVLTENRFDFTREIIDFTGENIDFANMFSSISMQKLTEFSIHLKRPRESIILSSRVPGVCGSVFYVSNVSGK